MPTVPQRYRRTDRQIDGRTDGRLANCDSNTALALRASRGKNDIDPSLLVYRMFRYSMNKAALYILIEVKLFKFVIRYNTWYILSNGEL